MHQFNSISYIRNPKKQQIPNVMLVSAVRTPMGSFLGGLSKVSASQLGSVAIKGALTKGNVSLSLVDKVFMGNVLQAEVGQAPARQAALGALE